MNTAAPSAAKNAILKAFALAWLALYTIVWIVPFELVRRLLSRGAEKDTGHDFDGIVCVSFVEWFGAFQRPQHFAARAARR